MPRIGLDHRIRVLHVVHPGLGPITRAQGSDALTALCAQTIARTTDVHHAAVALGRPEAAARARALGVPASDAVPTPAGSLAYAGRWLVQLVRAHRPDMVHAWGVGPAHASADLARLVGVPVLRTDAVRADDPRGELDPPGSCARPGDLLLPTGPTRGEAADAYGLPKDAFVVALLSDAPGDGLAFLGVFSGGLLHATAGAFALLVSRDATGLDRAAAFKRRTAFPWPLRSTEDPMLQAVRAAHVVWVAPGRPGRPMPAGLALAAGACQAAGIPVVTDAARAGAVGGVDPSCIADGEHAAALFCATNALAASRSAWASASSASLHAKTPGAERFADALLNRWRATAEARDRATVGTDARYDTAGSGLEGTNP